MPFNELFAASAISGSGMSAERLRMEVVANNIANANATRSANGGAAEPLRPSVSAKRSHSVR